MSQTARAIPLESNLTEGERRTGGGGDGFLGLLEGGAFALSLPSGLPERSRNFRAILGPQDAKPGKPGKVDNDLTQRNVVF